MLIGCGLPVSGTWATGPTMARIARKAEALGYASLWTFQRLLTAEGQTYDPVYRSVHDPIVALAYAAAVTERVRLGIAIVNAPFYAPIVLAKQLTTLDHVSGGRLDVGLGLGWSPEEFAAAGVSQQRRGPRTTEFLACLRAIWSDEVVEYDGEFYTVPRSRVEPKPLQKPYPPILLGGAAEAALRRVGRIADGWISGSRADLAIIGTSIGIIKAAAEAAGRDPAALRFVVRGVVKVGPEATPGRAPLTGSVEQVRTDLAMLAEQGVTETFVDLNFDPRIGSPEVDPAESVPFAEEVLTALAPGTPVPRENGATH